MTGVAGFIERCWDLGRGAAAYVVYASRLKACAPCICPRFPRVSFRRPLNVPVRSKRLLRTHPRSVRGGSHADSAGGAGSGDGAATRGIVRLAPLIWPRHIDKSSSGFVVLEVTIPKSRLRPKSYKILRDDAGFADVIIEMLDRSKVEPPLFNGERMELTVRWAFHVCWDCEMIFHSSHGLFVEVR